jgi:hypothetical protein
VGYRWDIVVFGADGLLHLEGSKAKEAWPEKAEMRLTAAHKHARALAEFPILVAIGGARSDVDSGRVLAQRKDFI